MNIIGLPITARFIRKHPRAKQPLEKWISLVQAQTWSKFTDIKKTFNTADYFRGFVIFDIHGNDFRLIAVVLYTSQDLIIKEVFTHAEYDEWNKQMRKRGSRK